MVDSISLPNAAKGLIQVHGLREHEFFFLASRLPPNKPVKSYFLDKKFARGGRWSYDEYDIFYQCFLLLKMYSVMESIPERAERILTELKNYFSDWRRDIEEIILAMHAFDAFAKNCMAFFTKQSKKPYDLMIDSLFFEDWFVAGFFEAMNKHTPFNEQTRSYFNSFLSNHSRARNYCLPQENSSRRAIMKRNLSEIATESDTENEVRETQILCSEVVSEVDSVEYPVAKRSRSHQNIVPVHRDSIDSFDSDIELANTKPDEEDSCVSTTTTTEMNM